MDNAAKSERARSQRTDDAAAIIPFTCPHWDREICLCGDGMTPMATINPFTGPQKGPRGLKAERNKNVGRAAQKKHNEAWKNKELAARK